MDIKKGNFQELIRETLGILHSLPDYRVGSNTKYTIADAALSAFSVFFTQCPSFLSYQRDMEENKGRNNAKSLFSVESIPSDNQIRNLLDPIESGCFSPIFDATFNFLESSGHLENYRTVNDNLLIAVDGVNYHSSHK